MTPKFLIGDRVRLIEKSFEGYTYNRPLGSKGTIFEERGLWAMIQWDDQTPGLCANGGYFPHSFHLIAKDTFEKDGEE